MNKDALKILLRDVKTIAIVGASSDPNRDSFKVMKYLKEYGYDGFLIGENFMKNNDPVSACNNLIKEL